MKVAVVINSKAGRCGAGIEERIREALFRCQLVFSHPSSIGELETFLEREVAGSDYLMICGGDGTINVTLRTLLKKNSDAPIPPICLVSSGTANDLATEIGVSEKIEVAARSLLRGKVKKIDLIEIESEIGEKAYMLTNGGVGIPAVAAGAVNKLKDTLREWVADSDSDVVKRIGEQTYGWLQKMGPKVYTLMAAEAVRGWKHQDWELEIEMPEGRSFVTKAPSVLVNNQKRLGSSMITAPYTDNSDGLVNVLVSEAMTLKDQIRAVIGFRNGIPDQIDFNRAYEVPEFRLKSRNSQRPLTFFGDGEILLKDVQEVTVRCRRQHLPVVVRH